jgi:hypothetical protein
LIDDVIVRKSGNHVELDVRLRNVGGSVANVTRAELDVLERTPATGSYKRSASYELLLDGNHLSTAIAHVLQPDEVDSFVLRLGFTKFNTMCFFRATITLRYNGDEIALSKHFLFDSCFQ